MAKLRIKETTEPGCLPVYDVGITSRQQVQLL